MVIEPVVPRLAAIAAAAAALLGAGAAPAQGGDDRRWRQAQADAQVCAQGTGVSDLDIVVCTRAIRLGGHSQLTLGTLLGARGRAYRLSGRLQPALADQDAALAANPLSAHGHHDRALVRLDLGQREAALADLDRAITLSPLFSRAWRDRGWVRLLTGADAAARADLERAIEIDGSDAAAHAFRGFVAFRQQRFADAAADFQAAAGRHLGFAYTPLWQYLALARAGQHDAAEAGLRRAVGALLVREWPRALLRAYLGEVGAQEVMDAAHAGPGHLRAARAAQAAFYLGQLASLRGRAGEAAAQFELARQGAPRDSVERALLPGPPGG